MKSQIQNFKLIYLVIFTCNYSFAMKPSASPAEQKKPFAVELLNYESDQKLQFHGPSVFQDSQFNNLEEPLIFAELYAENISQKRFEQGYINLLKENCPKELRNLLKKIEVGSRINLPTKILLTGPSGSGKSSLAQIIAQKSKPNVYMMDGGSFANEYQNSGIQNLMRLFEPLLASQQQVAIIIDELTALTNKTSSENKKQQDFGMIQKLWTLLDKCDEKKNILVIATANDLDEVPTPLKTRFAAHT